MNRYRINLFLGGISQLCQNTSIQETKYKMHVQKKKTLIRSHDMATCPSG